MKIGPLDIIASGHNVGKSAVLKKMYVILYDDGTTCLTRFRPNLQDEADIVAFREVQIAKGDGMEVKYVGAY